MVGQEEALPIALATPLAPAASSGVLASPAGQAQPRRREPEVPGAAAVQGWTWNYSLELLPPSGSGPHLSLTAWGGGRGGDYFPPDLG